VLKDRSHARKTSTKTLVPRKSLDKSMEEEVRLRMESEKKMGKCPLFLTFHYFYPKKEASCKTASDKFFGTPSTG
jgi:hypothetical protein